MELDRPYYRLIGVKKEFPGLNPIAAGLMELGILWHTRKHRCVVKGYPLPQEGAAIITGNHISASDPYETGLAGRRAGRLIHAVVKKILIQRGAYESDEYLRSIREKRNKEEYNVLKAFVMRGIGSIGVLRDNPDTNFLKSCYQVLDTNQLLGIFLQDTRDEEGLLRRLRPGAAYIASHRKHRDVPIYPIAFSEHSATVLEPVTYNQLRNQLGRDIKVPELTIILADIIVSSLPQRIQDDWKTRKAEEYKQLITPLAKTKS